MDFLACIDINFIFDVHNNCRNGFCSQLQNIVLTSYQIRVIHPEQLCGKQIAHLRLRILCENTASGYIYFTVKGNSDRMTTIGCFHFLSGFDDTFHRCLFIGRQSSNLVSDCNLAGLNLTLESAEGMIRTAYSLYRHGKSIFRLSLMNVNILQISEERLPFIPRHMSGFQGYIISLCGGNRQNLDCLIIMLSRHHLDFFFYFLKSIFIVMNQIHFIDCKHKMFDSHKSTDTGMASCLHQHPLGGIYKNHCQFCKGSTNSHISGVFFMTRCIGNDKRTFLCGKISISHIDGNPLLSFCHQTIQQQRIINGSAAGAHLTVQLQCSFLICK